MVKTDIYATRDRQDLLEAFGIKFAISTDFYFIFRNEAEKKSAVKSLKSARLF